jgi:phasin family protein
MVQDALHEVTTMAQNYQTPGNPQDLMSKQADFARRSFETTLKNASEVADLVRRSSTESVEILRDRIRDAMAEIRAGYGKK